MDFVLILLFPDLTIKKQKLNDIEIFIGGSHQTKKFNRVLRKTTNIVRLLY